MKTLMILLSLLFFQIGVAKAQDHQHHDHGKSELKLSLNNGKKWPSDAPLRKGMSAIHDLIKAKLDKIDKNKMTDKEYKELAANIQQNIDFIFKNCKLEPKADEQLHIVLAQIMSANSKLTSNKSKDKKEEAVDKILDAYKSYLKYFKQS